MPKTTEFFAALKENGYDFFTGVPCSLLKGVIRRFDEEPEWGYISAVREDSALGIADRIARVYVNGRQVARVAYDDTPADKDDDPVASIGVRDATAELSGLREERFKVIEARFVYVAVDAEGAPRPVPTRQQTETS